MNPTSETSPLLVKPIDRRLESIDLLRGLLMLLMALDHTRDYFSSVTGIDPTDPVHSWPALFAARWVTHLCAPGFIALAGASVFLQRQRGRSRAEVTKLLLTRGLWLVWLEITLISYGWSFSLAPVLMVMWAIGVSMIFLGALQRLPLITIGVIGGAIVLLHNLLDPISSSHFGETAIFWTLLHRPGPLPVHGRLIGFAAYPLVPWIGVICLGYAFGPITVLDAARRQRFSTMLGIGLLFVFALLRCLHGYGDHNVFQRLSSPSQTAMSFFQVEKYPPSLQYLLATFGMLLPLYAIFDLSVARGWLPDLRRFVETYGRVPFFYYGLHIYLLHAMALLLTAAQHLNWRFWLTPGAVFLKHLDGWGYSLYGVYLVWFTVVLTLYFPCLWFSQLKARRRDWWLSYL